MNGVKKVPVRTLVKEFNFEQIAGDDVSLDRPILMSDTNRPGLELAGYFHNSQLKRLVILGDKEIAYIETMSQAKQKKCFDFITSEITPGIIITKNHPCPPILEKIAKKKNFPILRSPLKTYQLIVRLVSFLDEELAPMACLHGTLLSVYGKGVLIRGESGMGKSEIALELIKRGHQLIADDRVDCYRIHNDLEGRAPELLQDMLELRGIGVVNVTRMFGISATLPKAEIHFEIVLEKYDPKRDYDRVGIEEKHYTEILGVKVPSLTIPVKEGRSMAVIIESAVTNYRLCEMGLDSAKEFENRVLEYIINSKES